MGNSFQNEQRTVGDKVQYVSPEPEGDFPIRVMEDIVVILQHIEEKSAGGIVLLAKSREFPCGRVVAVGPGRTYTAYADASGQNNLSYFKPTTVKVGDFAVFGKYQSGGEPLEVEGRKYLLCREGDLCGVTRSGEHVSIRTANTEKLCAESPRLWAWTKGAV